MSTWGVCVCVCSCSCSCSVEKWRQRAALADIGDSQVTASVSTASRSSAHPTPKPPEHGGWALMLLFHSALQCMWLPCACFSALHTFRGETVPNPWSFLQNRGTKNWAGGCFPSKWKSAAYGVCMHFSGACELAGMGPLCETLTCFKWCSATQPTCSRRDAVCALTRVSPECDAWKAAWLPPPAHPRLYTSKRATFELLCLKRGPTGASLSLSLRFLFRFVVRGWPRCEYLGLRSESSWGFWLLKEANRALYCYCASCRGLATKLPLSACFYWKRGRGRTEPITSTGLA